MVAHLRDWVSAAVLTVIVVAWRQDWKASRATSSSSAWPSSSLPPRWLMSDRWCIIGASRMISGFVYQTPAGAWGNQAERAATAAADRMNLSG